MSKWDKLDEILLQTLSFYDPLTREQLLLQLDTEKILDLRSLTIDDLALRLKSYQKRGIIKVIKGKDPKYLRLPPRPSFFQRFLRIF